LDAFTYFVKYRNGSFVELALKGPLTEVWLDLPAFLAVAYDITPTGRKGPHTIAMWAPKPSCRRSPPAANRSLRKSSTG
jgi:hypothetical protein